MCLPSTKFVHVADAISAERNIGSRRNIGGTSGVACGCEIADAAETILCSVLLDRKQSDTTSSAEVPGDPIPVYVLGRDRK